MESILILKIIYQDYRTVTSGFPPGMFEWGDPKGVWGLGVVPQEKTNLEF